MSDVAIDIPNIILHSIDYITIVSEFFCSIEPFMRNDMLLKHSVATTETRKYTRILLCDMYNN